jgi:hypothetical protein
LTTASLVAVGTTSAAACVDLFHSTDYLTLCMIDAAACAADGAPSADAAEPTDTGLETAPPAIDFCAWTSEQAKATAERACAWMGACLGVLEHSSFGACMIRALAAYDCRFNPSLRPRGQAHAQWACLADVSSCEQVRTCLFGTTPPVCQPVEAGTFTACTLDEGAVAACGRPEPASPPVGVEPCLLEGRMCVRVDTSTAVCAGKHGIGCSGSPRCDGAHAVECKGTTDVGIDCAVFGSGRCVADDAGVGCAPIEDAGTCTDALAVTCDDAGVARRCLGGKEITIACDAIGQPCVPAPSGSVVDPIAACTNTSTATRCSGPDECSGGVIRSCAQGKLFELKCSSVGLRDCVLPPNASFVACTPP